eukprot:323858-Rhodomonas_salina.4
MPSYALVLRRLVLTLAMLLEQEMPRREAAIGHMDLEVSAYACAMRSPVRASINGSNAFVYAGGVCIYGTICICGGSASIYGAGTSNYGGNTAIPALKASICSQGARMHTAKSKPNSHCPGTN